MASSSKSSAQPFTRANVFSTILTIQLCQLTQPSGSLIFPGKAGLFWRSNPIASFLEGCMIVRYISSAFTPRSPGERSLSKIERIKNVGYVLLLYRRGDLPSHDEIWTTSTEEKLLDYMKSDGKINRWFVIGLITTIPEIATCVKLFGVSEVPFLTGTIMCMVFAWLCVQFIQLLVPSTDNLRDMLPQIQRTAEYLCIRFEAEQRYWRACLSFLHLPLAAYLGYKATGTLSPDLLVTLGLLKLFMNLYLIIGLIWFFIRHRYLPMPRTIAYLLAPGLLTNEGTNRNLWMVGRVVNFLLVFETSFFFFVLSVLEGYDGPFKYIMNFVFFRKNLSDSIPSRITRKIPSAANIIVAAGTFTTYLVIYDSEGTNKASWTEWLG